jgi:hypothetical protein
LPDRKLQALLGLRLELARFGQLGEEARGKQVGLLEVGEVGVVLPLPACEAAVARLGRDQRLAPLAQQRRPELRLLRREAGLQRSKSRRILRQARDQLRGVGRARGAGKQMLQWSLCRSRELSILRRTKS